MSIPAQTLVERLNSADLNSRLEAENQLVGLGHQAADSLIEAMQCCYEPKSWRAAKVLAQIKDERVESTLIQALQSPNPILRQIAAELLGQVGSQAAIEPLVDALRDTSPLVQIWAVRSLSQLNHRCIVAPLLQALHQTQSSTVRYTIIEILGNSGDSSVADAIRRYQNDEDHHVRSRAARALHKLSSISQDSH